MVLSQATGATTGLGLAAGAAGFLTWAQRQIGRTAIDKKRSVFFMKVPVLSRKETTFD
jgi:hypothetical protein